jgi:hypothetical protein
MLELLCQLDHFPRRPKDRLVALFLPKLNVKVPVRELTFD